MSPQRSGRLDRTISCIVATTVFDSSRQSPVRLMAKNGKPLPPIHWENSISLNGPEGVLNFQVDLPQPAIIGGLNG
jgi:hypothetical protein